jgi:hypothetical protein
VSFLHPARLQELADSVIRSHYGHGFAKQSIACINESLTIWMRC